MAGPGAISTLVGGVGLLFVRSAQVPLWSVLLGLALFAVIVSAALLQAPRHDVLSAGFDRGAYEFLPRTNWSRTAAWSAYGLLDL